MAKLIGQKNVQYNMRGLIELLILTTVQSSSGWLTSKIKSSEDELRTLINVRSHWMFALRNCPGREPQSSFIFAVINFKLLFCVHRLIRALGQFPWKSLTHDMVCFWCVRGKLSQFIRRPQPVHIHNCDRCAAETSVQEGLWLLKCTDRKWMTDFLLLPHVLDCTDMLQRPQTKNWRTIDSGEKISSHHTRRGQ